MNIVLLDTWRVIGSKGGTEKVFCNMANAFVNKGHNVLALACENKEGIPFYPLDKKVRFVNVGGLSKLQKTVREIKVFLQLGSFNERRTRLIYNSSVIGAKLSTVIKDFAPDCIISYTKQGTFYVKARKDLNYPVITMYHFNAEKILEHQEYHSCIENSECIQTLLERDVKITNSIINPKKIVTIPNVVPQFDESSTYVNKKIITVGRINRIQKRQHIVVEAMHLLKNKFPDWQVEFWGETDVDKKYYAELKAFISKYSNLSIKFCGTTDDVKNVYKNASIFACPSAYEGFPLALTEAMSLGLPAVGFKNCPAVNELIVDKKNGILCKDTVEDFARGLSELMENMDKRKQYGTQAKEDMKKYAPEIIWEQWEQLITETISDYRKKHNS